MNVTALIVAAGSGSRMGGETPKQYRMLAGKAVLAHAVDALSAHPRIDAVRVVIGAGQEAEARAALGTRAVGDPIIGGATRSQSVARGLAAVATRHVLVHDAARPFCPPAVIDRLIAALDDHAAAVPVLAVPDTVARSDGVFLTLPESRDGLVRVQTPQAFLTADLVDILGRHSSADGAPTDEASVLRAAGLPVATVEGDPLLDKLTVPADWARAQAMLEARMISRTGLGFDVHGFKGPGPVMLGGIEIAHDKGLAGHSDADVLLHAITDALLGAAALGDIGEHFPPSDERWKGASSDRFLAHAADLVRGAGGIIDHVDATVICEAPKVGPHRAAMRARIAAILALADGQVSVKATTTEKLGFTGRREGIACQAIATIRTPAP
ncbi:bifunctional 2-C-methyl-D-erythritol 4-phosphate cytidylyltransferase/2-C-methyl-D-erythritol 2,4-cyclodiphosphate synthase [Sphingomicrobium astaxanthinifaciens]|uniref:bifunctional 2-C-methyl-D-erythritol 4-phosphate cytidylyltransferase/2-C-methyl-D-erythritol 2,4-cyclodiphosphate synthase n=1 Tax=Sphingomicrobium astaxanthinifaciens TaxID=1227949 RepID=UPI001FCBDE5F|nr:bifunctional 2-C-methyl-D-erythritol 4-phosphate cytidylyltransferase/2-C-methyl-D-erythritol 2,4-cyclodiphosphate synthase [Sphingomicrobium astaxanthinifaciens]MCJ7422389.1 bifunctional 2-C-methyl-D-erythritol 4-phosphate cytidylyltransferase/2-C-methyl-D-erythritol 2,4-cyclodiphosphate synthase [Sphingomicrobium astaxanthinifaciens]